MTDAPKLGRNLVVLFDGTSNNDLQQNKDVWTNIVKIRDFLDTSGQSGVEQKWWWCAGVGSGDGRSLLGYAGQPENYFRTSDTADKEFVTAACDDKNKLPLGGDSVVQELKGLAFGAGTLLRVRRAYEWLISTYVPGDQIYVFGFSRGGFAARCFSGLLRYCGVVNLREAAAVTMCKCEEACKSCGKDSAGSTSAEGKAAAATGPKPCARAALMAECATLVYTTSCRAGCGADDDTKTFNDTFVTLDIEADDEAKRVKKALAEAGKLLVPGKPDIEENKAEYRLPGLKLDKKDSPGKTVLSPVKFRTLFGFRGVTGEAWVNQNSKLPVKTTVPFGPEVTLSAKDGVDLPADTTAVPYVRFLGVFDTVPHVRRQDLEWFFLLLTRNVVRAYHAVALDETRANFQLLLWQPRPLSETQKALGFDDCTVWFPGNHGDVGGGWKPTESDGYPGGVKSEEKVTVQVLKLAKGPKSMEERRADPFADAVEVGAPMTEIKIFKKDKDGKDVEEPITVPRAQALQEMCCTWMMHHAESAGLVFVDMVPYSDVTDTNSNPRNKRTTWRAAAYDAIAYPWKAVKRAVGGTKPVEWQDAFWRYSSASLFDMGRQGICHDAFQLMVGAVSKDRYSVREVDSDLAVFHDSIAARIKYRPARYAPCNPTAPSLRVIPSLRFGKLREAREPIKWEASDAPTPADASSTSAGSGDKTPTSQGNNSTCGCACATTKCTCPPSRVCTCSAGAAGAGAHVPDVKTPADMAEHPEAFGTYDAWAWMVRCPSAAAQYKGWGRSASTYEYIAEWAAGNDVVAV